MADSIVNWLLSYVVETGSFTVSWLELIAFTSGAVCVWLVGTQNPWNWPIGLIQVTAYLLLFWSSGLYGDSTLQIIYIVASIYGWWRWVTKTESLKVRKVSKTSLSEWLGLSGFIFIATIFGTYILSNWTTSVVSFPDALTTALSLAATYGQIFKKIESWWLWIIADLIYIPLYLSKGLTLTGILYAIFLLLCIKGLRAWQREIHETR